MLQINDIRESRYYQDALQEGKQEGLKEGKEEGIAFSIAKMASNKKMSAEEIANILELDVELVRKAMTKVNQV